MGCNFWAFKENFTETIVGYRFHIDKVTNSFHIYLKIYLIFRIIRFNSRFLVTNSIKGSIVWNLKGALDEFLPWKAKLRCCLVQVYNQFLTKKRVGYKCDCNITA